MITDENRGPAILVSGGAGYIGSHVVYALKVRGFCPVVIDNLVNGHDWAARYASAFYQVDVGDPVEVRRICEFHRPVAALHFAAFIEVGESVRDPDKFLENNYIKASRFFDALMDSGVNKVVFSSTAAVYGDPPDSKPIVETAPTTPINPYGQSKLLAETYLRSLAPITSITLRYFNVAGAAAEAGLGEAHTPESHLLPRLILPLVAEPQLRAALALQTGAKIFGDDYPTRDGTAIRDYVHVLDLAEAHVRALDFLTSGGGTDIFNVGSGTGYSVLEVVQAVAEVLGRPDFRPEIGLRRPGDPAVLVASSQKAARLLGWEPRRDIHDMVRSAAAWHRTGRYRDAILSRLQRLSSG